MRSEMTVHIKVAYRELETFTDVYALGITQGSTKLAIDLSRGETRHFHLVMIERFSCTVNDDQQVQLEQLLQQAECINQAGSEEETLIRLGFFIADFRKQVQGA